MNTKIIALAIISLTLGLTSCKKDTENPTITVTTPVEHSEHVWGEEVHLNIEFADDQGLQGFSIYVGNEDGTENTDFAFNHSEDISGTAHTFHEHFVVPQNAPAMAWLNISVNDADGKTSSQLYMLHFIE